MENKEDSLEEQIPEKGQENDKQAENWLKNVASQSYEPELLISGAAIYLTSNLPNLIEWVFDYYHQHLLSDSDSVDSILPILIYGFLKSNAYILIFTFLFHFVMRAFWVGFVGLYSVFPEGIRYEKLGKSYNVYFIEKAKRKLGSTEDFLLRLDRTCSLIFSVAFLMVMIFVGICFGYLMMIITMSLIHLLLGDVVYKQIELYLYFGLLSLAILPSLLVLILNLDRFKKNEKASRLNANLMWQLNMFIYPLIGIVLLRKTMIFRSNIASKNTQIILFVMGFVVVFVLYFFILLYKMTGETLDFRKFYATKTQTDEMLSYRYDNLRESDRIIKHVSIQSDVIKDNYIKLFINYTKRLDVYVQKNCSEPSIDTKLNKEKQKIELDRHHLKCLENYFKIYLNDSLITKPELIFYTHPNAGEKGVQSYIATQTCHKGKNLLKVEYLVSFKNKPDTVQHIIPFWYFQ